MTHFALVIGIDDYSNAQFNTLHGACSDAVSFYDWLRDPAGGNVPDTNIAFFTNPVQPESTVPPRSASLEPTWTSVRTALARWVERANETQAPIGTRLYIYLAGHGYNHRDRIDDVHLLLKVYGDMGADAFPGTAGGEWFRVRALFDEILLVMDCCRDRELSISPTQLTMGGGGEVPGKDPSVVRILFSYGAEYGRKSRERSFDEGGPPQGVFTKALLEGLRGAARDGNGAVTCNSLIQFLTARVPQLAPAGYPYRDPQRPAFTPSPIAPDKNFVICGAPGALPAYTSELRVTITPPYNEVRVWDPGSFDPATRAYLRKVSLEWDRQPQEWTSGVPMGVYVLEWVGEGGASLQRPIIVKGDCREAP